MSIEMVASGEELRKALREIELAEKNGFNYCLAVFRLKEAGRCLDGCIMEYSDLIEKAHPTDGNLNWGRFGGLSKTHKFKDGKLIKKKVKKSLDKIISLC